MGPERGWRAREGSFYIDAGGKATGRVAGRRRARISAPVGEIGRGARAAFGLSGSVAPPTASGASMLAADLVSGDMFGLAGTRGSRSQDTDQCPASRCFWPHNPSTACQGRAARSQDVLLSRRAPGVLIEKTGEFFRLITEAKLSGPDARPNRARPILYFQRRAPALRRAGQRRCGDPAA
jgi:hypothetical protein